MTIQFIFKSYTVQNLALVVQLFKSVFEEDKIQVYRYPTKIQKLTVLKSPHVQKNHVNSLKHEHIKCILHFMRLMLQILIKLLNVFNHFKS